MKSLLCMAAVALALTTAATTDAVLSGNLIQGGDFESMAYFKNGSTYDSLNNEVPAHRFNREADPGKWLEFWGIPDLYQGYNPNWVGLGGFTSLDNPRDPLDPRPWTRDDRNVSCMNRSVDPLRPGNHILDNAMFYPHFGQWFQAPAGHVAGPIQFSFDFFYDDWDKLDHDPYNDHTVIVRVYGANFVPPHNTTIMAAGAGTFTEPLGSDPLNNPAAGYDGELLVQFRWGGWYTDNDWTDDDSTNGWINLSTANPTDPNWTTGGASLLSTSVATPYDYYAIQVVSMTYNESSLLFADSFGHGDIIPTFSQGFDSFDFRVTVPEPAAGILLLLAAGACARGRRA